MKAPRLVGSRLQYEEGATKLEDMLPAQQTRLAVKAALGVLETALEGSSTISEYFALVDAQTILTSYDTGNPQGYTASITAELRIMGDSILESCDESCGLPDGFEEENDRRMKRYYAIHSVEYAIESLRNPVFSRESIVAAATSRAVEPSIARLGVEELPGYEKNKSANDFLAKIWKHLNTEQPSL